MNSKSSPIIYQSISTFWQKSLLYKCILTLDSLNIFLEKKMDIIAKQQLNSTFFANFEHSNSLFSVISLLCFYLKDIASPLDKDFGQGSPPRLYKSSSIDPSIGVRSLLSRYRLSHKHKRRKSEWRIRKMTNGEINRCSIRWPEIRVRVYIQATVPGIFEAINPSLSHSHSAYGASFTGCRNT